MFWKHGRTPAHELAFPVDLEPTEMTKLKPSTMPLREPLEKLCHFTVMGRAVPWKAPHVTRRGTYSDPRLVAWQEVVSGEARLAYGCGEKPYTGPVSLQ